MPGVRTLLVPGDITDRITRATSTDNLYLNTARSRRRRLNRFGNAPRILPGVYSPWRNNVDLGVSKNVRTGGGTSASVSLEVLNMFNIVQWAGAGELAVRQFVVRPNHQPGEQRADGAIYAEVPILILARQ